MARDRLAAGCDNNGENILLHPPSTVAVKNHKHQQDHRGSRKADSSPGGSVPSKWCSVGSLSHQRDSSRLHCPHQVTSPHSLLHQDFQYPNLVLPSWDPSSPCPCLAGHSLHQPSSLPAVWLVIGMSQVSPLGHRGMVYTFKQH